MTAFRSSPSLISSPSWPARARRWSANFLILLWLLLAAHQAGPFVPERIRKSLAVNRVARLLGVWQHRWPMFAPEPDSQNQSLEAVVTFADGTSETWRSPDWRSLSPARRFLRSRDPKLYENLQGTLWSPVWPEFSRQIAAEVGARHAGNRPQRVELYLELARIDPPEENQRSWLESTPVTERHLFHVEELP
jgi:hypothetical protein